MSLIGVLLCIVALLSVAAIAAPNGAKGWAHCVVYGACAAASAGGFVCAATALVGGDISTLVLPIGLPWLGVHWRLDALAAGFLAVVNFGGLAASIFALGYGRHETAPERVLPFIPVFLAGMNLVVIADDALAFLFSWEFMSLSSWALVVSHDRTADNLRAGLVYIVMASFGTLALVLAFAVLAGPDGNFAFAAMRDHGLSPAATATVLFLALLGAGSKAGLFPLHAWLPLAHPAAPSQVSALMSGVMTKVAVYAFVRIVFDLLGPIDWPLAMVVIVVGTVTAFLGVLYALLQNDLKRLLAYSTVENIGIIFVGLGLALAFRANGLAAAAALAMTGALLHVLNHSLFKSLLFFGAGAVQNATGERDMDRLGGLIHAMPRTAFAFLIGSAAISALPPLNGFASEWLIFQATFLSPGFDQWGLRLLGPASAAVLALAAALAAASFVKAFGVTFLGRPRSGAAQTALETDKVSLFAMGALALLCVVTGIVPGYLTNLIAPIVGLLTSGAIPVQPLAEPWSPLVPVVASHNTYSGLALACGLIAALLATAAAVRLFADRTTRRSAIWDCGHLEDIATAQYSAGSFAQPIRRVFASVVFRARETVVMPRPGETGPAQHKVTLWDPAWDVLYAPAAAAVRYLADRMNGFQYLTIRRYLALVFAALVLLLTVLALWP